MLINQQQQVDMLLREAGMDNCNPVKVSFSLHAKFNNQPMMTSIEWTSNGNIKFLWAICAI